METIASWVSPFRPPPALSSSPPSTSYSVDHGLRRSLGPSSFSTLSQRLPDAAASLRIQPPPSPMLRNRTPSRGLRTRPPRHAAVVASAQFNVAKVLATAWRVAKDGVEAGTNLVPDSVPRPLARIGVAVVAGSVVLFVLKSLLSTAFFVLAVMGLIYFTYIALNAGEDSGGGPGTGGGGGSTTTDEDSLEEARRIMEKYK